MAAAVGMGGEIPLRVRGDLGADRFDVDGQRDRRLWRGRGPLDSYARARDNQVAAARMGASSAAQSRGSSAVDTRRRRIARNLAAHVIGPVYLRLDRGSFFAVSR